MDVELKGATYLGKSTLSAAQGANQHLHVTFGERGHLEFVGVVRHDARESVDVMALGNLEGFGFWLLMVDG